MFSTTHGHGFQIKTTCQAKHTFTIYMGFHFHNKLKHFCTPKQIKKHQIQNITIRKFCRRENTMLMFPKFTIWTWTKKYSRNELYSSRIDYSQQPHLLINY